MKAFVETTLEIHLLGRFSVAVAGVIVGEHHWSRRKPKLLIKLLALQPHHELHREQLMELLWPELDREAAANNLHKAIHLARHTLESDLKSGADSHFILTQGPQVVLSAPDTLWIDAEEFERRAEVATKRGKTDAGEEALALYTGDLLVENPYEEWTTVRREQLRAIHQDLLAKLAHLYEARGEYDLSIERLKRLIACDPSNEEAHRRLMLLYAWTGNRHQALRQYKLCQDVLRRELETDPERATLELHDKILAGQIQTIPQRGLELGHSSDRAIESLAILPFINSSADPNAEYLSDGITESIISNLSQLHGLRVMARGTVLRYKGREVDPQEAGRELNVGAILMGRVLQLGDRLIIRTELIDTADGAQMWGEQYDQKFTDVLAVQEEIAKRISEGLQLRLTGEEQKLLTKRHTEDTEAYQAYLKGLYFWNKRTEGGLMNALEHFNQAVERDPDYALAHAVLASSYVLLSWYSVISPKESSPGAKASASRALELDDSLAEAHVSAAWIKFSFDWDYSGAEEELKRALELNPDYATAHQWYALYLSAMGRHPEAIAEIERALALDPPSLVINRDVGWVFYWARQYDRAIESYRRTLELAPSFYIAHYFFGETYERAGRHREAIAEFRETKAHSKEGTKVWTLLAQARAHALLGKRDDAERVLDELMKLSRKHYVSPYLIAIVQTSLGEKDQAFRWLENAYQERDPYLTYLKVEPALDKMRSDPRLRDLVQRVGFPPEA